ncbi:hypothetical protein DFP72DRAFT_1182484 [Ephemerocybe angulata]|uniref:Uncharacterized protein n=1 Tax=Ephemerocybe angulata TaxID=980116 RepID=A0A8H6H7B0_9AGAR|nr:hypothetical protein DFP72DRAFT_1182484 [Tulosesus angulatus]
MPDLTEDLIPLVLRELYFGHPVGSWNEHEPDRTTLRHISLVNSTWNGPAQALLLKSVLVNSKFTDAFLGPEPSDDDSSRRSLLQHVRIATFPPQTGLPSDTSIDALGRIIVTLLERCTSLYELGFRASGPDGFSDAVVDSLRRLSESQPLALRSLMIYECGLQSPAVRQLVSSFPTIEFLSINCEVGPRLANGVSCNARLYELRLTRNIPDDLLRWLLQSSEDTLQVLELRDVPGRKMLNILKPYCNTIRSLRLMTFNLTSSEIVNHCQNLEELVMMGIPNVFPLPTLLPVSLHHLSIVLPNVTERTRLRPYTKVVVSHGALRSVRCRGPVRKVEDFPGFEEACKAHNVALVVEEEGVWLGFWKNEPCVKADVFPRRRSVSNFNLMN